MAAKTQYEIKILVTGDDYPATDVVDQIEDHVKGLFEGSDITGDAEAYHMAGEGVLVDVTVKETR